MESRGVKTIFVTLLLIGCGGGGDSAPPAAPPEPPPTGFTPGTTFTNITDSTGISHVFSISGVPPGINALSDPQRFGGGVAASDVDRDGDIDLYLVAGDGSANRLFRNEGNNVFTDVAADTGLDLTHMGSGPVFADIDGDNDVDLFVGSVEGDRYYLLEQENGQFMDVTAFSGIEITAANSVSASFADYDLDGDLDFFVTHWGNPQQPDTESLWQNNGDGRFFSASIEAGIADTLIIPSQRQGAAGLTDYTFTSIFTDLDNDGDQDLVVAADFQTSQVYVNNGDGTFLLATDRNVIIDDSGMGTAVGDYDNDGDMDWFVTAIYQDPSVPDGNIGNRLYRNLGDGTFEDVTEAAGVADGGWGWGSCMEDFDNDGDLDIFHVNGFDSAAAQEYLADRVRYFESQGDGTFIEAASAAGLSDTGQGRGVVCFDSDRDGDLDIFITNNTLDTDSNVFYRNDLSGGNHYLGIKLVGKGLNTAGIGARIEVTGGGGTQVREIRAGNNFVSQNPAEAHFGIGEIDSVDVTVLWPDGGRSDLTNVTVDQLLIIQQP